MKATQQFIEDAIKGGWKDECGDIYKETIWETLSRSESYYKRIFLDPLAWQAVGKTLGREDEWRTNQMNFIWELQEGKTIEQALQALN